LDCNACKPELRQSANADGLSAPLTLELYRMRALAQE
jgi:hypothetical protein